LYRQLLIDLAASIFARFGAEVTVVEMLPRILPLEDPEVSDELKKILSRKKIRIHTDSRLENISLVEGQVEAVIATPGGETRTIRAEKALIAVGRTPVTEGIGLERLGISTQKGFIPVDEYMQTGAPGTYAIGDCVPTPLLAHVASHEGILAMRHIAGEEVSPLDYNLVPNCTYCSPEVASVGLTEAAAREKGFEVVTSKFPFAAIGKASILGENDGWVKMVCDSRHKQILGIHMIGPHVTELVGEATALIGLEAVAEDVSHLIHAHPTVSEGIMEAAHAIYGAAIHY